MILIALQFYAADRDRAMRLARMIADIEPRFRDDVEILFCARFDTPQDSATIEYVQQKFIVRQFTTVTKWTGWPGGPNGMARDVLREIGNGQNAKADGVLMIEPDCVPVAKDWLDQLAAAWRGPEGAPCEAYMMGAWRDSGPVGGHINGNCMVPPEIGGYVDLSRITEHYAWDCQLSELTRGYWKQTDLIRNLFQETNVTEDRMIGGPFGRPALVHGVKDDSGYDIAKKLLFL